MKKLILAMISCLFIALFFTACPGNKNTEAGSESTETDSTTEEMSSDTMDIMESDTLEQ